jgi:SAM-dependent methyltransferase
MPALYGELAQYWPIISPVNAYEDEGRFIAAILKAGNAHEILEFGCGGGHLSYHLRDHFTMTLTDISPEMVDMSRRRNPMCDNRVADMFAANLGRDFDAVLIHDAADYILDTDQMDAAFRTARKHVRPGGMLLVVPDHLADYWQPSVMTGGSGDVHYEARYCEREGGIRIDFTVTVGDRVIEESHDIGLFPQYIWVDRLRAAGFAEVDELDASETGWGERTAFVAHLGGS